MKEWKIVYEDKEILVIHKPANLAVQTARLGEGDMVSELKNYLSGKSGGKGEPYVGVVHRLDQPVEGLVVFAKNKAAAADLSRQTADHTMKKQYCALVPAMADHEKEKEEKELQTIRDCLVREGQGNRSQVTGQRSRFKEGEAEGKEACLRYRVAGVRKDISLLEIQLETGRHHQIRVQLAHAGMPVLGDGKYGNEKSRLLSIQTGCRQMALCACKLEFTHPQSKKREVFQVSPLHPLFSDFGSAADK